MLNSQSQMALAKICRNLAAVGVFLLVTGCGGSSHGTPVSVSGKVTLDGKPLSGLTVIFHCTSGLPAELRSQRAKTDDQGAYSLPEIYPGEYTILFEQAGEAVPEDPGMAPADLSATDSSLAKYKGDNAPSASVSDTNTEFNFALDSL
ncbi:MAG: carboxypeptidase regulatory-like domain-containing protein [Rhodopirellula sp.]|nr:carboxypeptidase regulatory-like domain-containing protein [Rhodopirellula sp.]